MLFNCAIRQITVAIRERDLDKILCVQANSSLRCPSDNSKDNETRIQTIQMSFSETFTLKI